MTQGVEDIEYVGFEFVEEHDEVALVLACMYTVVSVGLDLGEDTVLVGGAAFVEVPHSVSKVCGRF